MISALSATASRMSPRFAGGRYSVSRIFSAEGRSRLGPRKTMIFGMLYPVPPSFGVHRIDFKARNYYPNDRHAALPPGQVDDDHPVEPLFFQGSDGKLDIFCEIVAVIRPEGAVIHRPVVLKPVPVDPFCPVVTHLFPEPCSRRILACAVDLGEPALRHFGERTHRGDPCTRVGADPDGKQGGVF